MDWGAAAGAEPAPRRRSHLAPVLARLHRASGLTLRQLADRLGVSASQTSRIVSVEDFPGRRITERFAHACGADAVVLRKVWEDEVLRERRPHRAPDDDRHPGPLPRGDLRPPHGEAGRPDADVPAAARKATHGRTRGVAYDLPPTADDDCSLR